MFAKVAGCIVLLFVACFLSCSENSLTAGNDNEEFAFKVTAVDADGAAVPDLRVSAWNDISWVVSSSTAETFGTSVSDPTVRIRFNVEARSDLLLIVNSSDGSVVDTLVAGRWDCGSYAAIWCFRIGEFDPGTYKFVFTARDTASGATLFSDFKYATYWVPAPEYNVLGFTNVLGRFETNNGQVFPSLNPPDQQIGTNSLGDELGIFEMTDSITIVLTDTMTSKQQTFRRELGSGENRFNLVWSPEVTQAIPWLEPVEGRGGRHAPRRANVEGIRIGGCGEPPAPSSVWRLFIPFPNPFGQTCQTHIRYPTSSR